MKNLFIIFNIFLTVSNGCDGCKDEPLNCNGYMEYPQLLKDYFLFKDSSYWIYKDSVTGTLDSFWVVDYKKESYWPHKITGTKNCPCYEIFDYKIKRSFSDKFQRIYFDCYYRNMGRENEGWKLRFDLVSNNQSYNTEDRFVSIGPDSIWNETPVLGGYIYKLPQIEVNNKTYKDIQFLNYPTRNPYDWVRRIYYSKNIGAIKFEDEDGRVWELVRYRVKQ